MPFYEFHCNDCEIDFDVLCSYSEIGDAVCEGCGSKNVVREWKKVGIVFKGGGFYSNDSVSSDSSAVNTVAPTVLSTPPSSESSGGGFSKGKIRRD